MGRLQKIITQTLVFCVIFLLLGGIEFALRTIERKEWITKPGVDDSEELQQAIIDDFLLYTEKKLIIERIPVNIDSEFDVRYFWLNTVSLNFDFADITSGVSSDRKKKFLFESIHNTFKKGEHCGNESLRKGVFTNNKDCVFFVKLAESKMNIGDVPEEGAELFYDENVVRYLTEEFRHAQQKLDFKYLEEKSTYSLIHELVVATEKLIRANNHCYNDSEICNFLKNMRAKLELAKTKLPVIKDVIREKELSIWVFSLFSYVLLIILLVIVIAILVNVAMKIPRRQDIVQYFTNILSALSNLWSALFDTSSI